MCVVKRIYADPANPDKKVRQSDLAYYDADVASHKASAIESLAVMLKQSSMNDTVRAHMQQTLDALVSTRETLVPTWETAKSQMGSLLAEAKLLLMQRGVDGEAQVIETMQVIDAVLNNMKQNVEGASTSQHGADFLGLYSKEVKKKCEFAVGRGRDPLALEEHLVKSRGTAPDKERLEKAVESVRPRVRAMAEELKRLLTPYAQPLSQDEGRPEARDTPVAKVGGKWQKA